MHNNPTCTPGLSLLLLLLLALVLLWQARDWDGRKKHHVCLNTAANAGAGTSHRCCTPTRTVCTETGSSGPVAPHPRV